MAAGGDTKTEGVDQGRVQRKGQMLLEIAILKGSESGRGKRGSLGEAVRSLSGGRVEAVTGRHSSGQR